MKIPSGRKAILLLGLPIGLAAGGAFIFMQMSASGASPYAPDPSPGQHGPMLALDERVINLQAGGSYRYAKVGITVELRPKDASFYSISGPARAKAETDALAEYQSAVPILLDVLGSVVGDKTSDDLTKPDGRSALKTELLTAMRAKLGDKAILDLYFTDLVMQ